MKKVRESRSLLPMDDGVHDDIGKLADKLADLQRKVDVQYEAIRELLRRVEALECLEATYLR